VKNSSASGIRRTLPTSPTTRVMTRAASADMDLDEARDIVRRIVFVSFSVYTSLLSLLHMLRAANR
jgi:hypothetical protein